MLGAHLCGSFIDMKVTMKQLVFSTFFSFVLKSGKRISMLGSCRDNKSLAHQDLWRPAPYHWAEKVVSAAAETNMQELSMRRKSERS